jgi:hypothetical protein
LTSPCCGAGTAASTRYQPKTRAAHTAGPLRAAASRLPPAAASLPVQVQGPASAATLLQARQVA